MTKRYYDQLASVYATRLGFYRERYATTSPSDDSQQQIWNEFENTLDLIYSTMRILRDDNPKFDWFKFSEAATLNIRVSGKEATW